MKSVLLFYSCYTVHMIIYVQSAGFTYSGIGSRSRENGGDCIPRLKPKLSRFCPSRLMKKCTNDKDCKNKERCLCHEYCGKRCLGPSSSCIGDCVNGQCKDNVCQCHKGWTGKNCSTDIDECNGTAVICSTNAACINTYGSYTCTCLAGFKGVNCSTNIDECKLENQPKCLNNGTCVDGRGRFTCNCIEPYTGSYCQYVDQCKLEGFCDKVNTIKCVSDHRGKGMCKCNIGFGGHNCSEDINECEHDPCVRGTCKNNAGSFKCICPQGFTDPLCATNVQCDSSPCKNGAKCLSREYSPRCLCLAGYTGARCETKINYCNSDPCKNGAQCVGHVGRYECKCQSGFKGKNCDISISECLKQKVVCQNNGSCIDGDGNYTCSCSLGFKGSLCETEINECEQSPCHNGANCSNTFGSYVCSCPAGYTGVNCEIDVNDCTNVTCLNDGYCKDQLNSYMCICKHPGFTGRLCEIDIDECQSQPCRNGGVCEDGIASYKCTCPAHKTGQNCDVNLDNCVNNYCMNGATCQSKDDSYICLCKPGYTGHYCGIEVDKCLSSPCVRGKCIKLFNDYECRCPTGYKGRDCSETIDYCSQQGKPCYNNGSCVSLLGNFKCHCRHGFRGERCEYLDDQCLSRPCQNGATCTNGIGGYTCYCQFGYEGDNCEKKINWCSAARNPCKNGAPCSLETTNSWPNHFNCKCTRNYTGKICDMTNWANCADITTKNGSLRPLCMNGGKCEARSGYSTCNCAPGFTGSYCEIDIDECQSGPCKNGATCIDKINDYKCHCYPGFTGTYCEINTNECDPNPCVRGRCYDLINEFHCRCDKGFTGDKCDYNPDDCKQGPCLHGGTCIDGIGDYRCQCPPGFTGKRCEEDINECLSNPCSATGTDYCKNLVNAYECKCRQGYTKQDCSFDINECLSKPCRNNGSCIDEPGKFICQCPYGFSGKHCEIPISNCQDEPCQNDGICEAQGVGYRCRCKPGVKGLHCEYNIDDCSKSSCRNGGRCIDGYDSYKCDCTPGYHGKQCQKKKQCDQTICKNGGLSVNDGGICYCQCLDGFSGESCEEENECPNDCSDEFSTDVDCLNHHCNRRECNFAGLSCSLNLQPWRDCQNARCFSLFADEQCNPECDTKECLFDAFDCRSKLSPCKNTSRCAQSMSDDVCHDQCNTESCGYDGLDCDNSQPKYIPGVLLVWLRMEYHEFQSQRNIYLLNMSRVLRAVVTIETVDGLEKVEPVAIAKRRRRRRDVLLHRYKRGSEEGTKVNLKVDNRKCVENCFTSMEEVANYMGGMKSKNQQLPGNPFKIDTKDEPTEGPSNPPFKPLWIAIICVCLPLLVVGVLAGGKRVFAKLWLPDGFPSKQVKRRSQRHDPVGEDSEDKSSIGKCSTSGEDDYAEQLHSGRAPKRLKLISDDGPLRIANPKDNRQWTTLHREVADVNNRTISSLSVLTPPQEGQECSAAQSDVNATGPGGLTPLMVAVTRGNYLDGTLDDDKDSDDSNGQVVGELIQFGARIESTADDSKETALHLAARHARADAARRLLEAGADANAKDRTGRTPLHLAVTADAQGVFQILLRHRSTHLDEPADDGTTPLIYAARFMVDDMVENLIKAGAKVNLADKQGKTALHWAASVDSEIAAALLLKNNAKRDAQDSKGQTPLFLASKEGSASVVKLLLSSFANRKLADNMDQSPLDIAKQRDHADIAKLLSDWSIGCKSPTTIPTSPGSEMSPLAARTLSPPDVQPKTNRTRAQPSHDAQKQTRKKRRKSRTDNDAIAVALVASTSPPSVSTVNRTSPAQGLSPFSSNSYGSSLSPSNSTFSPPLRHMDGMPSPLRDSDPLHNGVTEAGFYRMPEEMTCYGNSLNGVIPDAEFMNIESTVDINDLWLFDGTTEQNKDCMYGSQYPPGNVILSSGLDNNHRYYGVDRRGNGVPAKTCVRSPSELTAWNSLCDSNGVIKHSLPTVATVDTRRRPRNQDCQYPSPPYELSPASPNDNQWSSSSSSRASNSDCSTC